MPVAGVAAAVTTGGAASRRPGERERCEERLQGLARREDNGGQAVTATTRLVALNAQCTSMQG